MFSIMWISTANSFMKDFFQVPACLEIRKVLLMAHKMKCDNISTSINLMLRCFNDRMAGYFLT